MNLNLGSGKKVLDDFVNIDKYIDGDGVLKWDLENGIPLPNNSVDKIICSHTLEHLNNVYHLMVDIERVQKSGGTLIIKTPIYCNLPQHRSFFISRNWIRQYYNKKVDTNPLTGTYKLVSFKKNGFGIIKIIKRMVDRFIDWINSFLYEEYEWELKKL